MYTTCLVCGSAEIIRSAAVEDGRGYGYPARRHAIYIAANPSALLFRDVVESTIQAYVCGECGYVALFAENPRALYRAYQAFVTISRRVDGE